MSRGATKRASQRNARPQSGGWGRLWSGSNAARLSPFKPSNSLDDTELETLYDAIRTVLGDAVIRSAGLAASELKGEKRSGLQVHARTGLPCPVCGDTVREVSFADSSLQYCATCQTGGKPLADRRLSKLLR